MENSHCFEVPVPNLFEANPHFSDRINSNIIQSEIEGGVHLSDLPPGSALSMETRNRVYEIVVVGEGTILISGHPEFCPEPAQVEVHGSTWGGSMIKKDFIGRGMHFEFEHPVHRTILTSRIKEIRAR